ncbi:magnesium-translocating P-type ATPase [Novosphingobium sp. KACC 22771]|uniref:magnesium-translocating P-type ATPase n=1 Tax=Novosphingobium sp. KACC 22771 TaxID=3025670 RepID=UPI002365A705|nr:magnesium-translocating P-type ATPase [Novosphingobium sp. KACC 22771]WDF72515.1 magnesium-translocating P-type ATPase [Novosphingobium sp. KACC 22771]
MTASLDSTDDQKAYWSDAPASLLTELDSRAGGLGTDEAERRLAADGPNELAGRTHRHLLVDWLRRLANPLVLILLGAAGVAGSTGDVASFVIIVGIVALSTLLDMVQERRAEATVEALRCAIALDADVWRDGQQRHLPVAELVRGDVVDLAAGDLVPADGVALSANAAQVNQAALTGEPFPVEKSARPLAGSAFDTAPNLLLAGSSMVGGTARMLVVRTGAHTRFGTIAQSLRGLAEVTAFEQGLHRFGYVIARMTIFLVLFVLLARLALGKPALESFLFAMALAVGLTPELLPMIVTITLARGARRMSAARVVVKRMSAIHDLGEMDVLCTDKTGTLTEARIVLVACPGIDGQDWDHVAELAAVNARFETGLKSPLDDAVLARHGAAAEGWGKLDERPFDFERRRVSVLAERDGRRLEIVKGAPETVLALCADAQARDGTRKAMDATLRGEMMALYDAHAAQGLRLLGVAWKDAAGRDRIDTDDDAGLSFVGFCVFVDPPKPSARDALARLGKVGVRVKLVSGDALAVARHLAQSVGLPVREAMSGEEIAALSDAALAARVQRVDLFARVSPDQKLRIVHALKKHHTVGFIGDGINDAPAIHAADVGLSVDGATDVAREAADMIMLDSDLHVLADGIAEGRRTYANIMKYLRMGTSSNFGNMLTMALASLFLPFLPLTAVQILLNNLLYDLSQTGIPFDTADSTLLGRPHRWNMRGLMRFTAVMGPLSTLFDVLTFGLLLGVFRVDVAQFRSAWFVESMATQILVVLIIRTAGPFWRNRPHPALLASALGCLCVALALPWLPWAVRLGFAPLPAPLVGAIIGLVAIYLTLAEAVKRLALPRTELA